MANPRTGPASAGSVWTGQGLPQNEVPYLSSDFIFKKLNEKAALLK